jgi:hypothetical protein
MAVIPHQPYSPTLHIFLSTKTVFPNSKSILRKAITYSHVFHRVYWIVCSPHSRSVCSIVKTRILVTATRKISGLQRIFWQLQCCVGQIWISKVAVWAALPIIFRIGARSHWQRGLRHGSAAARLLGLWARILQEARKSVSCEYCML